MNYEDIPFSPKNLATVNETMTWPEGHVLYARLGGENTYGYL